MQIHFMHTRCQITARVCQRHYCVLACSKDRDKADERHFAEIDCIRHTMQFVPMPCCALCYAASTCFALHGMCPDTTDATYPALVSQCRAIHVTM